MLTISLALFAALAAALWLIGAGAARLIDRKADQRLDRVELLVLAGPLGAYLAAWLLFVGLGLGLFEFSGGLARFTICASAVLLGGWFVGGLSRSHRSWALVAAWRGLPRWGRLIALLLAAFVFGQVARTLCEPLAGWDAQMYRLPYSHVVFATGRLPQFASPSSNDCFAYPPAPMLLYALGWGWVGRVDLLLPKLFNIAFGLGALAWVYLLLRRTFERGRGPALLGAILCAVFLPIRWPAEGSDWMLAYWSLAALYFVLRQSGPSVLWAGICSGLAIMTKHHGLISLACLAPLLLLLPGPYLRRLGRAAALAAIALAVAVPWMLRNWLLWQNPLYPAALPLLGGAFDNHWVQQNVWSVWQQPHLGYRAGYAAFCFIRRGMLLPLVGAPFVIAALPRLRVRVVALWVYLLIGLGLLLTLGITPAGGGLRLFGAAWAAAIVLLVLVVELLDRQGRGRMLKLAMGGALLITLFALGRDVLLTILDSSEAHRLWDRTDSHVPSLPEIVTHYFWPLAVLLLWIGRRRIARLPQPGAILVATLLVAGWPQLAAWPAVSAYQLLRGQAAQIDWQHTRPWEPYGRWVQENLPHDAVLLTFNTQRWVVPRTILSADSPLLRHAYDPGTSEKELLDLLAQLGVTHVVQNDHNQAGHPLDHSPALWPMVEAQQIFKPVYSVNGVTILEVRYNPQQRIVLESDIERPWLWDHATFGPLAPRDGSPGADNATY
ncbi:MAG: hypothetical protein P9M14_15365 [Candidatus Alcyoniella australis]|nr:hypothetical protein [Candidatus Alcyoniella australis]